MFITNAILSIFSNNDSLNSIFQFGLSFSCLGLLFGVIGQVYSNSINSTALRNNNQKFALLKSEVANVRDSVIKSLGYVNRALSQHDREVVAEATSCKSNATQLHEDLKVAKSQLASIQDMQTRTESLLSTSSSESSQKIENQFAQLTRSLGMINRNLVGLTNSRSDGETDRENRIQQHITDLQLQQLLAFQELMRCLQDKEVIMVPADDDNGLKND